MTKTYSLLFVSIVLALSSAFAETHVINISGFTYSPATVNAVVGDEIVIAASGSHPLVQVDQATWNANGTTPMIGGWGSVTSEHTFTITTAEDIYFVCGFHAGMGMKGMISVSISTDIEGSTAASGFLIAPNPVTGDFVRIQGDPASLQGCVLEMYDVKGQLVLAVPVQNQLAQIGNSLTPGVYTGVIHRDGEALLRQRIFLASGRD